MSKLLTLFEEIKEESLTKDKLESYHKAISELYAQMHLEVGQLKKKRGMFMLKHPELTGVAMKRAWEGSEDGQRLIELESYVKATSTQLSSLKSRLFSIY